jgi:hypothetical protein
MRATRWAIAIVGGLLIVLAIIAGAGSRTSTLRQLVIDTLSDRLDSEVQLDAFSVDTFPTVHVTGTNLIIRHRGRRDVPPLVMVRSFALDGGLFGFFSRPRRFRTVALTGLQINIPPGFKKEVSGNAADSARTEDKHPLTPPDKDASSSRAEAPGTAADDGPAAIVVDTLTADDAALTLIPKRAGKEPKVFAIHRLTMKPLGRAQTMTFEATVTNPIPKGLVKATGTFGPWHREDPGGSPLGGRYTFDHADLGTVKGIGGELTSTGIFEGELNRIGVKGETRTPNFSVDVSGKSVPLQTKFEAVVDGTDGDTYLNAVSASFLKTSLTARGAIVGAEGIKGRTVKLHVKIDDGRVEDVLRLGVKGDGPVMTGRLALHADLDLPAGPQDVMDRLKLEGQFDVAGASFNNPTVQAKLSDLSERARGLDPVATSQKVSSNLRGQFRLERKVLTLREAMFGVPGAAVQMAGSYGLATEALEFDGTVRMQATVSQAAGGGFKSVLLKAVDPLFRRDGAGAVLPIRIRGSRNEPKFGLDFGRTFKRE